MKAERRRSGGRPNRGDRQLVNTRIPVELVDMIDELDGPRGDVLWEAVAIYLDRPDLGPASKPTSRKAAAEQQGQLTMPAA